MTKPILDSGGSLKLPGESNAEFATLVHTYLANFSCYNVRKDLTHRKELYEWCAANLGEKYKDWFVHEGGAKDSFWCVNIRSPKKCTWFTLRWNDIIIDSVDRRNRV